MLAGMGVRLSRLLTGGLDADAVEEGRIEIHDATIMSGLRPRARAERFSPQARSKKG
jgi:hypothetical protein